MTSISNIVQVMSTTLLIHDSEPLIEKQSSVLLDELIEFDLLWSDETTRQTHSNKILWSSSWCFRGSLRRNCVLQARISKFEFFSPSSSDVEYNLRHVCAVCVANPVTLTHRWRNILSHRIYRHHSQMVLDD